MRIGIDFGSTYSTFSTFNEHDNRVEALTPGEGIPASIPSVVSIRKNKNNNNITCGSAAKDKIGSSKARIFQAFKMLLNEEDYTILSERGYDAQFTPRKITAEYLECLLAGILKRKGESEIEDVYICVPEIWAKNIHALDGRSILRTVLTNEIDIPVRHVRVVTEPEAASAFFAYNYEKETKKQFNGYLLLIDYGGGTLDLTLTEVQSKGNGTMEIRYKESGGAGENHKDQDGNCYIGSAGMAYMQDVVTRALQDSGVPSDNKGALYQSAEFTGAVRSLESLLKDHTHIQRIEDTFGSYGSYSSFQDILDDDPIEFDVIDYEDEEIPITYQQLFLSYRNTIEPVLKAQVEGINRLVQKDIGENPCNPEAGMKDNFKIALVGGFGGYYLVKMQIAEIYHLDSNAGIDPRTKNMTVDQQELAISYGAALLAAGKMVLQKTARYSIGLYSTGADQKDTLHYGIKYHQNIETGKTYYLLKDENKADTPDNRITYFALKGNIKNFAIEDSPSLQTGELVALKQEMLNKLDKLPEGGFWNCGFSMDESDVVSFHVTRRYSSANPGHSDGLTILLDSWNNMFNLTESKRVKI